MKIVVVGAGGRLGAALMREYRDKFEVTGFDHAQLDLANLDQFRRQLAPIDFDVLINAAAFTNVDLCEKERDQAFLINADAPKLLAEICRDKGAKLIHFSTDYVFDGEKREPYLEKDEARPISVYGDSKRAGEENVLAVQDRSASAKAMAGRHLVVRVSWVFGPDGPSFVDAMIKRAREHEQIDAVADKFSAPTYTADIAKMLPRFFGRAVAGVGDPGTAITDRGYKDYGGVLHFANVGECSWQEYGQFALDCCRSLGVPLKAKAVGAIKLSDMKKWVARRPVYSVLSTAKYIGLTGTAPRNWRDAVGEYLKDFYFPK
ncbi:MAG: dTDP-4-dehydrorhamnose reductase [Chthoniobacterales bacterium]